MSQTNADICREIARLKPDWYVGLPGVAVRHPTSGNRMRRLPDGWFMETDSGLLLSDYHIRRSIERRTMRAVHEALAAGPDWTDTVTVNALLGDGRIWEGMAGGVAHWCCQLTEDPYTIAGNRTTAILLAYLASLGG